MSGERRKEITYHLPEEEIDELLREATDNRRKERLGFLKNLYYGDSVAEAADREGRSAATGRRWADVWSEGGLDGLMPSFGGSRPPKLDEDEQEELMEMLRDGQPWKSQGIQHLLKEEFDGEYHPEHLGISQRVLIGHTRSVSAGAVTTHIVASKQGLTEKRRRFLTNKVSSVLPLLVNQSGHVLLKPASDESSGRSSLTASNSLIIPPKTIKQW